MVTEAEGYRQKAEEESEAAGKVTNGYSAREAHSKLAKLYGELAEDAETREMAKPALKARWVERIPGAPTARRNDR
jgi:hypothetical protein